MPSTYNASWGAERYWSKSANHPESWISLSLLAGTSQRRRLSAYRSQHGNTEPRRRDCCCDRSEKGHRYRFAGCLGAALDHRRVCPRRRDLAAARAITRRGGRAEADDLRPSAAAYRWSARREMGPTRLRRGGDPHLPAGDSRLLRSLAAAGGGAPASNRSAASVGELPYVDQPVPTVHTTIRVPLPN